MARINFLPWREAARAQQQRRFLQIVAVILLLGLGLVLLIDVGIERMSARQQARNQYLEQANVDLDQQIAAVRELKAQRQQLLERMQVIEALQDSRSTRVRMFQELTRSVPDGLHFSEVDLQGQNLSISGVSQANGRISDLLRNLQATAGFAAPSLAEVKKTSEVQPQPSHLFRLSVGLMPPLPEETTR